MESAAVAAAADAPVVLDLVFFETHFFGTIKMNEVEDIVTPRCTSP